MQKIIIILMTIICLDLSGEEEINPIGLKSLSNFEISNMRY